MMTKGSLIGKLTTQGGFRGRLYTSYPIRLKVIRPAITASQDTLTVTIGSESLALPAYDSDAGAYYYDINEFGTYHVYSTVQAGSGSNIAVSEYSEDVKVYPGGAITYTVEHVLIYPGRSGLEFTSWENIAKAAAMGKAEDYWNLGYRKTVNINLPDEGPYYATLVGFEWNGEPGVYFHGFEVQTGFGVQEEFKPVAIIDTNYNTSLNDGTKAYNINHAGGSGTLSSTYGGWAGSDLRYDILGSTDIPPHDYNIAKTSYSNGYNPTPNCATTPVSGSLMSKLPRALRLVMAPMTVYSDNKGTGTRDGDDPLDLSATIDYLPLPDEYEIFGSCSSTDSGLANKQTQLPYYEETEYQIRYKHNAENRGTVGTEAKWWLRSPSKIFNGDNWAQVSNLAGIVTAANAKYAVGLAPLFRVYKE